MTLLEANESTMCPFTIGTVRFSPTTVAVPDMTGTLSVLDPAADFWASYDTRYQEPLTRLSIVVTPLPPFQVYDCEFKIGASERIRAVTPLTRSRKAAPQSCSTSCVWQVPPKL